jgi:hypothetical protein|tara:strand:- start:2217 stop:2651 length:435 start_codon:yes stop_codon:yes gene_type:complete
MSKLDGPQFQDFTDLWVSTYDPRPDQPTPAGARARDRARQNHERYGNRYNELSELARVHVNNIVNNLASYGGGHGLTGTQISGITSDPGPHHGPFFDTPEKKADAIDNALGFDPHLMGDFWDNPEQQGPIFQFPDEEVPEEEEE